MGIDWSKAPDGAEAALEETDELFSSWYRRRSDGQVEQICEGTLVTTWTWMGGRRDFPAGHALRPSSAVPKAWAEGGLPPVGIKCEIFCRKPHEYWAHHLGEVEIVAHSRDQNSEPTAVYRVYKEEFGVEYHALHAAMFRPIRTPEQIAAEERETAIVEMARAMMVGLVAASDDDFKRAEKLYAYGYRKQVNE